jgi:hypothetical protein
MILAFNIGNLSFLLKGSKITQLENDVRLLEDELVRLREDGTVTPRVQAVDAKQMEAIRSRERLMKGKVGIQKLKYLKYSSMFLFVNMNKYDVTKYHKLDIMNIC